MVTRRDYRAEAVFAAKSVLIELVHLLGEYREMKGMAVADRVKEKDPWDIDYCVRNYPGGMDPLILEFRPLLSNRLVQEGLKKIGDAFASVDQWGPVAVADFDEIADPEDRALRQRDSFERVNMLLERLRLRR